VMLVTPDRSSWTVGHPINSPFSDYSSDTSQAVSRNLLFTSKKKALAILPISLDRVLGKDLYPRGIGCRRARLSAQTS